MSSETECLYVGSRGILKSCSFHSFNPQSSCKTDTKYLTDMLNSNKMYNGMSIYVCSDALKVFIKMFLPYIKNSFVLVTGDSDLCMPKEILSPEETLTLLNHPLLLKWFAQNTRLEYYDKLIQLPIGLDYHTISTNPSHKWKIEGEGTLPSEQEEILINLLRNSIPFYERNNKTKIYANFTIENNDRFNQRKQALNDINTDLVDYLDEFIPRTINWHNMVDYGFVLSPYGMGMDCHRTWEAICLGCIPIVCGIEFKKLFEGLPVLVVKDWTEVTQELLEKTINEFKSIRFNYEKMTLKYWTNRIKTAK